MSGSRWLADLDGADRVIEAAERRRAVDDLIEGQRRLQAAVPTPPAEPQGGDTLVRMASLLGEQEGVALGWLERLGSAVARLVGVHEAAGWPRQHARQLAIMAIEDLAAATARAAEEHARLEQGCDPVVASPVQGGIRS